MPPYTRITPLCTRSPLHMCTLMRTHTHRHTRVSRCCSLRGWGWEVAGSRGPRPPGLSQRPTGTPPEWRSGTKAEAVSATPGVVPLAPCRGRARYRPLGPRAPGQRRALSRLRRKLPCSCKTPEGSFCSHPVAWFGVKSVSHPVFPAAGTATSHTGGKPEGSGRVWGAQPTLVMPHRPPRGTNGGSGREGGGGTMIWEHPWEQGFTRTAEEQREGMMGG